MKMDEGLDTGDMIAKVSVPLEEAETGEPFREAECSGCKAAGGNTPLRSHRVKRYMKSSHRKARLLMRL